MKAPTSQSIEESKEPSSHTPGMECESGSKVQEMPGHLCLQHTLRDISFVTSYFILLSRIHGRFKLGVMHICHLTSREAETGGPRV